MKARSGPTPWQRAEAVLSIVVAGLFFAHIAAQAADQPQFVDGTVVLEVSYGPVTTTHADGTIEISG